MQLALNSAFGVVVAIGLYFIGLPSPVLWGVVAGLCRFIPYVGASIAAMPLVVAAAVDPGWSMAVWTLALFVVTEPLMGQVIEPIIYGHSTGLTPVSVVIATIFWTCCGVCCSRIKSAITSTMPSVAIGHHSLVSIVGGRSQPSAPPRDRVDLRAGAVGEAPIENALSNGNPPPHP